jgi:hypothetical protein
VFTVHLIFYMVPVFLVNVVAFIIATVLVCTQPEKRGPAEETLNMNIGATNLMPREVEGILRGSPGSWELQDSAGEMIPLRNYSGGGGDGDIISAVVNYPMYVPTTVNPEYAAYRGTRVSTAGCECANLDKFLLFLRTWTALWAVQYLPQKTCNPLGSSTVKHFDVEFVLNIIQFFFILMDMLSAADFWKGRQEGGEVAPTPEPPATGNARGAYLLQ